MSPTGDINGQVIPQVHHRDRGHISLLAGRDTNDVRVLGHTSNWRRRDAARRDGHHRVRDLMDQDCETLG